MQVRIYTRNLTPITTLFLSDIDAPEYTDTLEGDGSASFVVRADSTKISPAALRPFNRVKFFEGNKCVYYGFISEPLYTLNTIQVKLQGVANLLRLRIPDWSFTATGTPSDIVTDLIEQINAEDDTGITVGSVVASGIYSRTYDNANDAEYIIRDIIGPTTQFRVDTDGRVQIANLLGADLSNVVALRYDIRQVESATITDFKVKETSQQLTTEIFANRSGGTSLVSSSELEALYGVIQTSKTYSTAQTTPELVEQATRDLKGTVYAPELTLIPSLVDNFDVCDILGVRLYNGFVDVATSYQVLEKSVSYVGDQKTVKVRLNDREKSLIDMLIEQKRRLTLLENA